MIERFKNVLISILIVLAVYQTNRLWFGESLNHNLFYNVFSKDNKNLDEDSIANFVMPYRIITSFSGNKFNINYSNLNETDLYNYGNTAIETALLEGEYMEKETINYINLFDNRGIIFDFPMAMPSNIYTKIVKQRAGLLTSKLDKFDSIIISLDNISSEKIYVLFLDEEEGNLYRYFFNDINLSDNIRKTIQLSQKEVNEREFYYISSTSVEDKMLFFPVWEGSEIFYYSPLEFYANYYSVDVLDKEISDNVNFLFDNPSAKWSSNDEGVLTYSDTKVVVKYYDNDILEYINYKIDPSKEDSSLLDDYNIAYNFIKNDKLNENEIYLSMYEEEDNKRHFYFNIVVNDFPIIIKFENLDSNQPSPELKYPIEITVEDGNVVKYKKLCYAFKPSENIKNKLNVDIREDINSMEPETIESVELAYYLDRKYDWTRSQIADESFDGNLLGLYHFIMEVGGEDYSYRKSGTFD